MSLNGFVFGGTNDSRKRRELSTLLTKFDITSQIDNFNLMKFGLEFRRHTLDFQSLSTISRGPVSQPPQLEIPARNTAGNNAYVQHPIELSTYLQDKIELNEIILNAGVRFDYWDAASDVLVDPEAVTNETDGIRISSPRVESDPQYQFSPRFGIAFPISSKGVLHISYGHFFQVPPFFFHLHEFRIRDRVGRS